MNSLDHKPKVILIEPYYGGSHKALMDTITTNLEHGKMDYTLVILSAKKWHWRARCGALILYNRIPELTTETVLFCSSVLNLSELLGLRPDLHKLKKIVYFHENQLIYPVQQIKQRDVQFAYNQITTSLAADQVLFNSNFNRTSFLTNISNVIKLLPDYKPKGIRELIEAKSKVLYFPVSFPQDITDNQSVSILHIVWPHRWEFDKSPEDFFNVMMRLKEENCVFRLSVLGETYTRTPEIFDKVKVQLKDEILHFGFVESKRKYFEILCSCHVVVSTAKHEFFGVSVLEAAYCGCLPLVPNNLVYPEIYPPECLYVDLEDLYKMLKTFCLEPNLARELRRKCDINFSKYSENTLKSDYMDLFQLNKNI